MNNLAKRHRFDIHVIYVKNIYINYIYSVSPLKINYINCWGIEKNI